MTQRIDFLVPGFGKCGTTTLCALLAQHPGIFIPALKEPWYFSAEDFEERGPKYRALFSSAAEGQLLGEGSVSYSGYDREAVSVERIHANNPHCRFIFIARNPIQRIESSYREMHHSGVRFGLNAPYSLAACLEVFPQMINDSCYMSRISRYLDRFGDEAIHVLFLEDLRRDPQGELDKCFAHLSLPTHGVSDSLALNRGTEKLQDSRLMRFLRTRAWSGFPLSRIRPERQDELFKPLGLRVPFRRKIVWDGDSRERFAAEVAPEAREFLAHFGKPQEFWALS